MIISRSVLLIMRNVSHTLYRNHNTHFMFNTIFFSENRVIYEIMRKNIVEPGRPHTTTWRMLIGCWIPKAPNTPSECVILIAFPLQQRLHKRVCVLRCTYIACFVIFPFLIPYAVWTEFSGRYMYSIDIKCIKIIKNYLFMSNMYRTFYFLKWRATSRLIQVTKHFRVRKRSECTSVWVGGMRNECACWENLLESTRKTGNDIGGCTWYRSYEVGVRMGCGFLSQRFVFVWWLWSRYLGMMRLVIIYYVGLCNKYTY
jgi:hypothetical protein